MFTRKYMRSRGGFSLAELLVVLAIMAILLGLMVGSFGGTDAARLTTAGNSVQEALTLARQNSIAQNAFTAFVVKTSSGGWPNASQGDFSSYCLWQFTYSTDGSSSGAWSQKSKWQQLPQGIFFDGSNFIESGQTSTDNFLMIPSETGPLAFPQPATTISFQGTQVVPSSTTMIYHIFRPDGTLVNNTEMRLRLVEGVFTGTSINYKRKVVNGVPINRYDVLILMDTGQVTIERN